MPSSSPLDEEETVYSCAVGVHSKTNEQRLNNLRAWYQMPEELNQGCSSVESGVAILVLG